MQSFKQHLAEKLKASDDMGTWVKDFQDSDAPQFKGKSKEKKRQMAVAAKLSAERNESWGDKMPKSERPGWVKDPKTGKWVKPTQVKKEEVELDEVSTEKLRDYASAALQDKNKAKADKRWKYAGKAMQTVADRDVKAAHDRKYNRMEEVEELEEYIRKNKFSKMTSTSKSNTKEVERFAIINDNDDIEVYNSKTKRLIRKVRMSNRQSAIQRLKKATYKSSLDTFKGYQMWYMSTEGGVRFSDVDRELEESTQIDELSKQTLGSYVKKAAHDRKYNKMEEVELDEAEMSLYDKIKAARKNPTPDKPVRGRGSKNRNPKTYDVRNKLDKEDDRYQDLIKKRLKKNEEVELEEKYTATSEKSQFGGHRPHLKNPEGKTSYLSGTAYKTAKHARGEAQAYHDGYFNSPGSKASESGAARAVHAYRQKHKEHLYKKESLDPQSQFDLVESYLLENNIDVDSLSVEQLDEIIGKVIGGAFKVGAKAAVGAAGAVKKAANRMTTAGRADAAEKRADAQEKKNRDRERIKKAQERLRAAQAAARS